jgi:hypothetical protein
MNRRGQQKHSRKYPARINDHGWKRENTNTHIFATFFSYHFTLSEHVVAEDSMTEAPIFVYRNTVNNYSEVAPGIAYCDIKKEPV